MILFNIIVIYFINLFIENDAILLYAFYNYISNAKVL